MSNSNLGGFLERHETRKLQAMYEKWVRNLKPDAVAMKLFGMNILSHYEREAYEALTTPSSKAAYLFHNVLMKSTYDDMSKIRRILIENEISGHVSLAKLMPERGEYIDFEVFPPSSDIGYSRNEGVLNNPSQCSQEDYQQDIIEEEMQLDNQDCLDLDEEPLSKFSETVAQQAGGGIQQKRGRKPQTPKQRIAKAAAKADYTQYIPLLPCYSTKGKGDPAIGSGLCVIIRNFTDDLIGYRSDAVAIKDFFENVLQYNVHKFEDLCEKDFRNCLEETQKFLNSQYNSTIDRFFLFILSHGDELGIKTCKPGSKKDEEMKGGQPVRITVDEVTNMFTHEKIPNLKGFPKCFFIQACQGSNVAQSAAKSDQSDMSPDMQRLTAENMRWEPPKMNIAVGSDILVCLPSEKGTYSWVPSTGSWFVQETIAIMRRYYKCEHLLDMMIGVNRAISQRTGKGRESNDSAVIDVCQMPGLSCSMTKKFFLSIPDMPPYNDKENA